jgi:hypothetical protein
MVKKIDADEEEEYEGEPPEEEEEDESTDRSEPETPDTDPPPVDVICQSLYCALHLLHLIFNRSIEIFHIRKFMNSNLYSIGYLIYSHTLFLN